MNNTPFLNGQQWHKDAALAAGRPLAAGPSQRGHARRRKRHSPRRRDGPARPRHSPAADGHEHAGLPAAAGATVGLFGGKCPTAAGCSSTWAIAIRPDTSSSIRWNGGTGRCRGPATRDFDRRGPAISSAATKPRCGRHIATCSVGFAAWKRKDITIPRCCCRSPTSGGWITTRRFRPWPISWPPGIAWN